MSRERFALQPRTLPTRWPSQTNASLAFLDRAIVRLGSARNAAPLLHAARPTILGIGSSVTGAYAGCTESIAPYRLSCTRCGGECGGPDRTRESGWLRRFAARLEDSREVVVPARPSTVLNGGRAGDSLQHYSECLESYMPLSRDLHLVVIELAVFRPISFSYLEDLVQSLLLRSPPPTVVLLRTLSAWYCDNSKGRCAATEYRHDAHNAPLAACARRQLEALSDRYQIAFVDQFEAMQESQGEAHVSDNDFYSFTHLAADAASFVPAQTLEGSVHPSALGMLLLADQLLHAVRSMALVLPWRSRALRRPARLPARLVGSTNRTVVRCRACFAFEASDPAAAPAAAVLVAGAAARSDPNASADDGSEFGRFGTSPLPPVDVVRRSGWEYVVDVAKNGHAKRGLATTRPGSTVTFRVDTRPRVPSCDAPLRAQASNDAGAVEGGWAASAAPTEAEPSSAASRQPCPQPYVSLEYLASFEHMGISVVECAHPCDSVHAPWQHSASGRPVRPRRARHPLRPRPFLSSRSSLRSGRVCPGFGVPPGALAAASARRTSWTRASGATAPQSPRAWPSWRARRPSACCA